MSIVWAKVRDFPDYAVSGEGHVMRLTNKNSAKAGRFLKPYLNSGYPGVCLCTAGNKLWYSLHRLIAEHFIPNPENKPTVNHKDGDKTNATFGNLEWATQSEQIAHAFALGLSKPTRGEQHGGSKLTREDVLAIRQMRGRGETLASIAAKFDISYQSVHDIQTRRNWGWL